VPLDSEDDDDDDDDDDDHHIFSCWFQSVSIFVCLVQFLVVRFTPELKFRKWMNQ